MAEGASVVQPPSAGGISWPPSQGTWLEALRPAWLICMAMAVFEMSRTAPSAWAKAASVASSQRPRSHGVMRPSGVTAVASMITMPAPDSAMVPRCTVCQDVARPSSAEYWHIGATTMRLGKARLRRVCGENKAVMGLPDVKTGRSLYRAMEPPGVKGRLLFVNKKKQKIFCVLWACADFSAAGPA